MQLNFGDTIYVCVVYVYWFYSNVMINSYTEKIQNGLNSCRYC